jgi:tetratricopeptide (TPR) repeat protein
MTSHIFLALGMWPESVDANIAAIAAVNRQRKLEGKSPLCCGHYPSWLGYAYLQLGKIDDAGSALAACRFALGEEAIGDQVCHAMDPDDSLSGSFANMRLRYLVDTGDWQGEVARWPLPKTAGPGGRLDFAFAQALGEIALGHVAAAKEAIGELETIGRNVAEIETTVANTDPSYRVRLEIFLLEARGLLAEHEGDLASAEKLLLQAVSLEESLPISFGPPTIDKPTHELLGEFLLRHDRTDEARAEFEKALARTPGRRLAEQGLAAASAATASKSEP